MWTTERHSRRQDTRRASRMSAADQNSPLDRTPEPRAALIRKPYEKRRARSHPRRGGMLVTATGSREHAVRADTRMDSSRTRPVCCRTSRTARCGSLAISHVWPFCRPCRGAWPRGRPCGRFTRANSRRHPRTERWWITVAAVITIFNIAAMGFYDVVSFRQHRVRIGLNRWRYGAVGFAWTTS